MDTGNINIDNLVDNFVHNCIFYWEDVQCDDFYYGSILTIRGRIFQKYVKRMQYPEVFSDVYCRRKIKKFVKEEIMRMLKPSNNIMNKSFILELPLGDFDFEFEHNETINNKVVKEQILKAERNRYKGKFNGSICENDDLEDNLFI